VTALAGLLPAFVLLAVGGVKPQCVSCVASWPGLSWTSPAMTPLIGDVACVQYEHDHDESGLARRRARFFRATFAPSLAHSLD
jgi:hypothetical protein